MKHEPNGSSTKRRRAGVGQRHRSAEEWRKLLAAWRASGKSSHIWCQDHGISRESLRRWKKRFGRSTADASLVELSRAPAAAVCVRITQGGELEFSGAITAELVRILVQAMRETASVR